MTRINVGVLPSELPNRLLLAEHREITRVPNAVRRLIGSRKVVLLPLRFTLGTGHVRFFYRRLGYLRRRYNTLLVECRRRGFDITDKSEAFNGLPQSVMGEYEEQSRDRRIVLDRICSKGFRLLNAKENHDG